MGKTHALHTGRQSRWRRRVGGLMAAQSLKLLGSWGAVCSHFPRLLRSTELGVAELVKHSPSPQKRTAGYNLLVVTTSLLQLGK